MPEPDTGTEGDVSGLGLGERLRSARKARALSLEQVAESLHLDESVVLALEEERFEMFGAPVYIRGHLKAYARLVGLPVDAVLEAYRKADPGVESETPVIARESSVPSVSINPVTWGFWGMVGLIGVALAAYVLQDDDGTSVAVETAADPVVAEAEIGISGMPMPDPIETTAFLVAGQDETQPATRNAAPEIVIEPELAAVVGDPLADAPADDEPAEELAAQEASADAGTEIEPRPEVVRLSLHFRQESWVEISDANRRLLFGLQREGRRRELTAEPPIRLLIGNAGGVDLTVNDEPYSVPMAGVTGKVARFEIASAEAD